MDAGYLRAQIDKAIQPSISYEEALFPKNGPFSDVAQFDCSIRRQKISPNTPEFTILGRLSHISVNPSKPYLTQTICSSYVYSLGSAARNADGFIIANRDHASTSAFLNELVGVAKRERQASLLNDQEESSFLDRDASRFFLLMGQRGVGKTFYLNYMLSKNSDLLDVEKVIWVRLNLVSVAGFDDDLPGWIYAQTAKIVFRYYDIASQYRQRTRTTAHDFYHHLLNWLKSNYSDPEEYYRFKENLDFMRDVFCVLGKDRGIDPVFCNKRTCLELFRYARELGYSFIVILDGFDRLDADRIFIERFSVIRGQVERLATHDANVGAAFVIALRDSTLNHVNSANPFHRLAEDVRYCVESVPFTQILEARVRAITSELKAHAWFDKQDKNWKSILEDFVRWLENNKLEFDTNYLEDEHNVNNRAKMQIVQLYFQEFIDETTRVGYRLLEHMIKCGFDYPPIVYEYRRTGSGIEIHTVTKTPYDSRFLPVLTRPPIIVGPDGQFHASSYLNTSVLHGLRIIQIVESQRRLADQLGDTEVLLTVEELAAVLHSVFSYDKALTKAYIDELESYEVIRTISDETGDMKSDLRRVGSLRKARFILDVCLNDVAYLNLAAMRTVVGTLPNGKFLIFRTARFDKVNAGELQRWINVKVSNAMALAKLITSVNEREKAKWTSAKGRDVLSRRLTRVVQHCIEGGMFSFVDKFHSKIREEIVNIWKNAEKSRFPMVSAIELEEEIDRCTNLLRRI